MTGHELVLKAMGAERTFSSVVLRGGLGLVEPLYRGAVAVRNAAFTLGLRRQKKLGRPTISVGNIIAGGSGKTPMVLELAGRLLAAGYQPAILLRGYKSGLIGSDEAKLLAKALRGEVQVEANRDRVRGAKRVLARQSGVDLFLLDDAFQHRQVCRDLDLVLLKADDPFGGDHLLPRGFLREPKCCLLRANAVIVTHSDRVTPMELENLDRQIKRLSGRRPIAHTVHRWAGLREGDGSNHGEVGVLAGQRVLGVCGIGSPGAFLATLRNQTARDLESMTFGDHHEYGMSDLQEVFRKAMGNQCTAVVTTEKDWVKWEKLLVGKDSPPIPVYRPVLEIGFLDGSAEVDGLIQSVR